MENEPALATLPRELIELQARWLELPRGEQDALYADAFAEPFARLFARLPLHGAPDALERPRALVSMLGFSWQPVALMAAWAKPERMLVLGTKESLDIQIGGEGVLSIIARVAGLPRDRITDVRVGDPGESEIYQAVRDFLRRGSIPARSVFVDPTGGKKSMSAAVALAAFLEGAPLVYVDYGRYHAAKRIPVAGTEYPRVLLNPLEVLGDLELRAVFSAFDRSDFQEAARGAERLAARLYEPREAQCLAKLAAGYGAWDRFEFAPARRALEEGRDLLSRFAARGGWSWAPDFGRKVDRNLAVLGDLAKAVDQARPARVEDGRPLLAWYLAAARRLLDGEKASLAVLLTYAAVERYVDLCLWVDYGLDDESPDYALIQGGLDPARYEGAGRVLFGKRYEPRALGGPLMFGSGAQLLATLAPHRLDLEDLGPLAGLASTRNKCEFEHGRRPQTPAVEAVAKSWAHARRIIGRLFGGEEALDRALADFRFPRLGPAPPAVR